MDPTTPMRVRIARFLSDRYVHRDRANYIPELIVLGLIIVAAAWPMLSLAAAMALAK